MTPMLDESRLAPVLIFTYTRLGHLKRTIQALRANPLAAQTELYIASDFQITEADKPRVDAVRGYLKKVDGFRSIHVIKRGRNFGAAENCFAALRVMFEAHDRFILMEDDIVTAPGFLTFMNQALQAYGDDPRVLSVSGYCPPIEIPPSYAHDAFFLGRLSAWGCGMTRAMFESVIPTFTRDDYEALAADETRCRALCARGGDDVLAMLRNIAEGKNDAWDVKCMYTQFLRDQVTVYPNGSLVLNIGHDGTGIHCGKSTVFDVPLSEKTSFRLPDAPFVDSRIVEANLRFRNGLHADRQRAKEERRLRKAAERAAAAGASPLPMPRA
jgi:hypothetical protein